MNLKPKVLLFDIETAPNLAYVWGKWQQDVIAYKEEWQMLSFAYKWEGKSKIYCHTRKDKSDRGLVRKLHKLFQKADLLVAHNGDEFDIKKAKARMLVHGLAPVPPIPTVDTKKVAKKHFNFNSNSLNDLCQHLGIGTKVKTGGFDLWLGCLAGNASSWEKLVKYNKQDIVLLEKLYQTFKPWILNHPNMALLRGYKGCPKCTSLNIEKRGVRATHARLQQRYWCRDCHGWFVGPIPKS